MKKAITKILLLAAALLGLYSCSGSFVDPGAQEYQGEENGGYPGIGGGGIGGGGFPPGYNPGGGGYNGSKPAHLSSNASLSQAIAKLNEIIAYCDANPTQNNTLIRLGAVSWRDILSSYGELLWSDPEERSEFIEELNDIIDDLDGGGGGNPSSSGGGNPFSSSSGNTGGGGSSDVLSYLEAYQGDGTLVSKTTYDTYDSKGNPTKASSTTYLGGMNTSSTATYEYNSSGKVTKMTTSSSVSGMNVSTVITIEYDSNGRETKMTTSTDMGIDIPGYGGMGTYIEYEYLSNGNKKSITYIPDILGGGYKSDGYSITEYNSNGDPTKVNDYNESGTLKAYSVTTYVSTGKPSITTDYTANGTQDGYMEYIYTSGRLTRLNSYDEDGNLETYVLSFYK